MRSPRILVVEDHPINRRLLQAQLAAEGWQSEVAATGAEALLRLARRHADSHLLPAAAVTAVVTDYVLEDMTGVELLHRVRAWEAELAAAAGNKSASAASHSPLPMILYSGMPLDYLKSEARGLDYTAIITKPISRSQLRAVLAQIDASPSLMQAQCRQHAAVPADPSYCLNASITGMPLDLLLDLVQFGEDQLLRLRSSIDTGALDQTAAIAHGLRGAAAVLQCAHIAQAATEIETQSRLGLTAGLAAASDRLQDLLDHLRRHIAKVEQAPNGRAMSGLFSG